MKIVNCVIFGHFADLLNQIARIRWTKWQYCRRLKYKMSAFGNEHWDLNKTTAVRTQVFTRWKKFTKISLKTKIFDSIVEKCFSIPPVIIDFDKICFWSIVFFFSQHHPEGPSYMSDVPPPFPPAMWNQEQPPPMVSYPELMGFPCTDLGRPGLDFELKPRKSKFDRTSRSNS